MSTGNWLLLVSRPRSGPDLIKEGADGKYKDSTPPLRRPAQCRRSKVGYGRRSSSLSRILEAQYMLNDKTPRSGSTSLSSSLRSLDRSCQVSNSAIRSPEYIRKSVGIVVLNHNANSSITRQTGARGEGHRKISSNLFIGELACVVVPWANILPRFVRICRISRREGSQSVSRRVCGVGMIQTVRRGCISIKGKIPFSGLSPFKSNWRYVYIRVCPWTGSELWSWHNWATL